MNLNISYVILASEIIMRTAIDPSLMNLMEEVSRPTLAFYVSQGFQTDRGSAFVQMYAVLSL